MTRTVEDSIIISKFLNDDIKISPFIPFVPWDENPSVKRVGVLE